MTHHSDSATRIVNVSRRGFLAGMAAGAFVLAVTGAQRLHAQEKKFGADAMPHGWRDDPKIFIAIDPDGTVTVTCHRQEMGQGVRTSIAMVIADELDADWSKVRVVQAYADEAHFGNQDTDGSRSLRHQFMPMRRAGAAARMMLEQAAAKQWGVPVAQVKAGHHAVVHEATQRTLGYGELAAAAADLQVPPRESLKLKDPSAFRYIGRDTISLVDNRDITTGKAIYGIDARAEGMLHAVIARPPVYGGAVASYDATETMKVPGVVKVVKIDPPAIPSEFQPIGGVAVIAKNTWAAIRGREKLKITWDDGPNAGYSSDSYKAELEAAARKPGKVIRNEGDVDEAMAKASNRVTAEYYIPHLAQAPMEPPAALVQIKDGRCEAWACVQAPQVTRTRLAEKLGMPEDKVKVNVTLLGGGFGRKSKPDFVLEAGILSQAMDGAPVQVMWTREDDLHHSFYQTVSIEHLEAGLDEPGQPIAWLHRTVAPTIGSIFAPDPKHELPFELGMGMTNMALAIPNIRGENPEAPAHVRIGWYRSVSNVPHAFAIQCFVSELAHAAGRDPKDYLLDVIGPARLIDPTDLGDVWNYGEDPRLYPIDTGRLRRVVETAAEGIGWGRQLPKGRGLGIAGHYSFVTYAAVAAEVEVGSDGKLAIPRVDIAVDCGPQVNPDRIRAQMQGAVVMGSGMATTSVISFGNGRVEQDNFDSYIVPRIFDAPKEINVHLIPGENYAQPLGGIGEPGLPPVMPAILNAVFAATGKRIRQVPIGDQLRA